jgi:hypothetical protein
VPSRRNPIKKRVKKEEVYVFCGGGRIRLCLVFHPCLLFFQPTAIDIATRIFLLYVLQYIGDMELVALFINVIILFFFLVTWSMQFHLKYFRV